VGYTPALLAGEDTVRGLANIHFGTPFQTIDAITFISDNAPSIDSAWTIRALQAAVEAFLAGGTATDDIVAKLADVAEFTKGLLENVIGNPENPDVHDGTLGINAQLQLGHWGFSVTGYGHTGLTVRMGPVYQELVDIYLTTDFSDSAQSAEAIERVRGLTDQLVDPVTGQVYAGSLPSMYAVTFADLMATAGYGTKIFGLVDVGANLKVINRRFTVNRLNSEEAGDITQKLFAGLESGITGVTVDLGGYYRAPSGFAAGLTLENVIPFKSLSKEYTTTYSTVRLANDLDSAGNPIVNGDGDTALVSYTQTNRVSGPIDLEMPFVANAGVSVPLTADWDLAAELLDVFDQQTRFEDYSERISIGTEYRLRFFGDKFHVSPRVGYSQLNPTAGLGLSYAGIVRLDLAYFTSRYVDEREMIAGQLSVAW
jgi:hypothetical protein